MSKHEKRESKAHEAREGKGGCGKGGKRRTMAQAALKRVKTNVRRLAK